jgi:hypothetical protein
VSNRRGSGFHVPTKQLTTRTLHATYAAWTHCIAWTMQAWVRNASVRKQGTQSWTTVRRSSNFCEAGTETYIASGIMSCIQRGET